MADQENQCLLQELFAARSRGEAEDVDCQLFLVEFLKNTSLDILTRVQALNLLATITAGSASTCLIEAFALLREPAARQHADGARLRRLSEETERNWREERGRVGGMEGDGGLVAGLGEGGGEEQVAEGVRHVEDRAVNGE